MLIHLGSSLKYGRASLNCNPISEYAKSDLVIDYELSKYYYIDLLRFFSTKYAVKRFVFSHFSRYNLYEPKVRLILVSHIDGIGGKKLN